MNRFTALLGAGMACAAITAQAVPNPVVTGPIPSTAIPGQPSKDYIFFASDHPLAVNGYIEEEYFIEGTANRYNIPTGATGSVTDGKHAYKTRVVLSAAVRDRFVRAR